MFLKDWCFALTAERISPARSSGRYAATWGIAQVAGCTGVCFNNTIAEHFLSTLKTEFYDRKQWPTRDAARKVDAYWIEAVYYRQHWHSALGMTNPVVFENHAGSINSRKEIAT